MESFLDYRRQWDGLNPQQMCLPRCWNKLSARFREASRSAGAALKAKDLYSNINSTMFSVYFTVKDNPCIIYESILTFLLVPTTFSLCKHSVCIYRFLSQIPATECLTPQPNFLCSTQLCFITQSLRLWPVHFVFCPSAGRFMFLCDD